MTAPGKKYLTVLYPNAADARFDWDYYLNTHTPKAKAAFGDDFEIRKGAASLDGKPPAFICLCRIGLESMDKLAAIMARHGAAIQADIANYTNVTPVIQIDDAV